MRLGPGGFAAPILPRREDCFFLNPRDSEMKRIALAICLAAGLMFAAPSVAKAQYGYGYGYRAASPNCLYGPAYRSGYGSYRSTSLYARPGLTVTSGYAAPLPRAYYYRPPVAPVARVPYYRAGYGYGYGRSYAPARVPAPGVQLRIGF